MKRSRSTNRRGITLLFVISMIVLFLLMGTAFVIVSNDYFRQTRRTSIANIPEITEAQQSAQLVEQAFFDLVRGPELDNVDSPLRGHDIFGDQYGYGFKAFVTGTPAPVFVSNSNDLLIEVTIESVRGADDNMALSMLEANTAGSPPIQGLPTFGGSLGGQVISITSGLLKGFSTRITEDRFEDVSGTDRNVIQLCAKTLYESPLT